MSLPRLSAELLESTLAIRKRKRGSDEESERLTLAPYLRRGQHRWMPNEGYEPEAVNPVGSKAKHKAPGDTAQQSQSCGPMSKESLDHPMPDASTDPGRPPRVSESSLSSWPSHIKRFLAGSDKDSFNSVRLPDPLVFSDSMPYDPTTLAPFLFRPRPPPFLPRHILAMRFKKILHRYNLLTKLIDDYQRWHGRFVFAFWTVEDMALANTGEVPALTKAFTVDRPSVPPAILNTPFEVILLAAPFLSHLIERYHRDRGYTYFAFFHSDPRDNTGDTNGVSSLSSRAVAKRYEGIERLVEGDYAHYLNIPPPWIDQLPHRPTRRVTANEQAVIDLAASRIRK
ncbi:hypothetical protein GGS24DRAFT_505656 [Hypoxylon argillaceum]|nr:hypothetical protein GGS24DRAFT_505656 [Hypoxylon argillaceum]